MHITNDPFEISQFNTYFVQWPPFEQRITIPRRKTRKSSWQKADWQLKSIHFSFCFVLLCFFLFVPLFFFRFCRRSRFSFHLCVIVFVRFHLFCSCGLTFFSRLFHWSHQQLYVIQTMSLIQAQRMLSWCRARFVSEPLHRPRSKNMLEFVRKCTFNGVHRSIHFDSGARVPP